MKVYWTARALRRLQQIHDTIAQDQPQNAQQFIDRLTRRADTLVVYPQAGRVVPEYRRDDIRESFEGSYRMIYRILSNRIDILTVRHGARLMPEQLRDL